MLVVPSPNSQAQLAAMPVDELVNVTLKGAVPLVGAIVKFATGGAELALIVAVLVSVPPGPVAVSVTV